MVHMTSTPPRWAVSAAHLCALVTLPTGIWRLLLATGHTVGYTDAGYAAMDFTGWGAGYVLGLSVLSEAVALLTLGLVRPWGEVLPRWLPRLGGRSLPRLAVVVPAALGALVLTVLWTPLVAWWALPHPDLTANGSAVVGLLYLPLVAWGPLLGAVTVSYHRRRVGGRQAAASPITP
ncbi:hypothetical protein ACGFR6_32240 [Streptomyces sp. NPDC048567]|uniref:hypothetical protein n=1 Tax=Streptomyces sp. NPDC048567 TaxID=3365570 RepID=UPI003718A410